MADSVFSEAIDFLGKQKKAAEVLGRSQSSISDYVRTGKPPAELCMKIEAITGGKYRADQMRPDLADVFEDFRKTAPAPSVAA